MFLRFLGTCLVFSFGLWSWSTGLWNLGGVIYGGKYFLVPLAISVILLEIWANLVKNPLIYRGFFPEGHLLKSYSLEGIQFLLEKHSLEGFCSLLWRYPVSTVSCGAFPLVEILYGVIIETPLFLDQFIQSYSTKEFVDFEAMVLSMKNSS